MSFGRVARQPVTEVVEQVTLVDIELLKEEDEVQRNLRSIVDNALDLPIDIVNKAKKVTKEQTEELRDYVMTKIIPIVLSIEPAMSSVKRMVPKMFDNSLSEEPMDVELPSEQLTNYGFHLGIIMARLKIIDLFDVSPEVKTRLIARIVPDSKQTTKE